MSRPSKQLYCVLINCSKKFQINYQQQKYNNYSTSKNNNLFNDKSQENEIKQFNDIPGPRGPFSMGTILKYNSIFGSYRWDELHKCSFLKYDQWGDIVRETMIPGVDVVWLFNPNDIAKVLSDTGGGTGNYPSRKSHLALDKFRKDRPNIYKNGGLLPTNGPEWWRIRCEFQKGLSSPQHVRNLLPIMDQVVQEFIFNINPHQCYNEFMPELARLNLEILCNLTFDVRMNSFSEEERQPNSITSRLIDSAEITNSCILPTDQGLQLWRLFETPTYKKLKTAQIFMENVALDLVSRKIELHHQEKKSKSILEEYLANPNVDLSDIVGMACDLLLAGIDTTTYTTCFVLYHLAKHPEVQEKFYQETFVILPETENPIDATSLNNNASYGRAILKESLRLNPISIGVGRNLNKDMILSGYHVPKGTVTVTQNMVASRLAKNFENPDKFLPSRWVRDENRIPVNPYLVLPFGHGMRACIARRLAEQSILVLMIRLIREFRVSWHGEETMDVKTHLINKPDQPIKLKFTRR